MKWKFWEKTKKVEEQPKKVEPIVIPEPIVQVHEYKGKIDHNEFNLILDDSYDGDEHYSWMCGKYEAKHQCMIKNDVIILRHEQIQNLSEIFTS